VTGTNPSLSTVTITCSSVNLAAHSRVYFGIRNDINANGNTMTGASPSGAAVYSFSSNAATSITYTSTTSVNNQITGVGNQAVTNTLTLNRTAGATTIVSTGGVPADNGNGDIQRLYRLDSGSSFTFTAVVNASSPSFSGIANPNVFDLSHAAIGITDFSKLDLGFYYSDCGDGVVDNTGAETCDLAGSNGAATSCCTATCTFRTAGQTCRTSAGVCDTADTCTGSSATCPADGKSTALCRGSVGTCDAAEFCDGAGNNCPADAFAPGSTVCRASGGACDIVENCTGTSSVCPADAKSTGPVPRLGRRLRSGRGVQRRVQCLSHGRQEHGPVPRLRRRLRRRGLLRWRHQQLPGRRQELV
jgi:hypothetical protein